MEFADDVRLHVKDIVEECHDIQEISLGFSHEYDGITEGQRVVEEDHEIMVQTLEKPNADIFLVPAWFFPLVVAYADNLPQQGNTKGLVLLQMADKEGSMGEGLKIFQGGAIPGPGEGVR